MFARKRFHSDFNKLINNFIPVLEFTVISVLKFPNLHQPIHLIDICD